MKLINRNSIKLIVTGDNKNKHDKSLLLKIEEDLSKRMHVFKSQTWDNKPLKIWWIFIVIFVTSQLLLSLVNMSYGSDFQVSLVAMIIWVNQICTWHSNTYSNNFLPQHACLCYHLFTVSVSNIFKVVSWMKYNFFPLNKVVYFVFFMDLSKLF